MNTDQALREHLLELLPGTHAHVSFDQAIVDWPAHLRGTRHETAPYTAWELLEDMRIAQWDILEFSRDANHVSPDWPDGYWPKTEAPSSANAWDESVKAFQRQLQEMKSLVANPEVDLFAKIPHGTGQTILREALLLSDHNTYHLGQLVMLRKILGAWPAA